MRDIFMRLLHELGLMYGGRCDTMYRIYLPASLQTCIKRKKQ